MASFAGVSVIADGELLRSTTFPTTASDRAPSGYHLLVVEGHSRTRRTRTPIESRHFMVGGHRWLITYDPGSISFCLLLAEHTTGRPPVKAQFKFSFIDETSKQEPARIHGSKILEFRGWDRAYEDFFGSEALEKHMNDDSFTVRSEALEKHLNDDSFTIRCDVVVMNHCVELPVPPSEMHQNFTDLLLAGEGTDVVFRVGDGEMVSTHRCVLAARSTVFRALLFGPMTAEIVQIDDMEATVFRAMLGYIYGDSLQLPAVEDDVAMLEQLLVAADRYGLSRLTAICKMKLRELRKMQIFVVVEKPRRAPVVLVEVSSYDTVASVKCRIRDLVGIPPYRQRLVYAGSALPEDHGKTLADHGVGNSSRIQLVETDMQVFVRMPWVVERPIVGPGFTIIFSGVDSSDTVETFRARFQEQMGIPPEQQRFIHSSIQLEDGHTLADYGVLENSTLHFAFRVPDRLSEK